MTSSHTFAAADLIAFAHAALSASGLPEDRSRAVAETLVEGDLMGHTTHGLQLLPLHLDAIERGVIARHGEPTIVADHGSAFTWDGNWLPGPWLLRAALAVAFERIADHPVVTIVLRRSGHIGCLAAYPRLATERGLTMLLACSDPSIASVAPHGAVEGCFTPNPIAAGWPTEEEPVIVDVCPSTTTNGMAARAARNGERLAGRWLIDHDGNTTDDPAVLSREPKGAVLPLGGDDLGHKGFALALIVEMMTASLGGLAAPTGRTIGARRCSCRSSIRRNSAARRRSGAKAARWRSPAVPRNRVPAPAGFACRGHAHWPSAGVSCRMAWTCIRTSRRCSSPGRGNSALPCRLP